MASKTEHTPGPWGWFGNAASKSIYLATPDRGRLFIMGFARWGMGGAQPTFRTPEGMMAPASRMLQFEVGNRDVVGVEAAKSDGSVYRLDIRGVANANARLIAAAPDLLEAARRAEMVLAAFDAEDTIAIVRAAIARATGAAP